MIEYKLTIMTPTYNRGNLLSNLYLSIKKQDVELNDVEWIIVDDGSTDNTDIVVQKFVEENIIDIVYCKVENGGKHRAVNKGIDLARGKYFYIVDSDDLLPTNSLRTIYKWFSGLEDTSNNYAGIGGLKIYSNNKCVGTTFDYQYLDCTSIDRNHYNIHGDKAEVFFTEVIKKYKFPEFEGEKFLSESILWNIIARDGYLIRWFNEPIYICEYLEDGLTKNIYDNLSKSPKGFLLYIKDLISLSTSELKKIYYAGAYYCLVNTISLEQLKNILDINKFFILVGKYIFLVKQKMK